MPPGAGDQAAASLGVGAVDPGDVFDSAGTASVFPFVSTRSSPTWRTDRHGHPRVIPQTYYALSFINGGGLIYGGSATPLASRKKGSRGWEKRSTKYLMTWPPEYLRVQESALFIPPPAGAVRPTLPERPLGRLTWGHQRSHLFRHPGRNCLRVCPLPGDREKSHPAWNAGRLGPSAAEPPKLWNQIKSDVLNVPYCRVDRSEVEPGAAP